MDYGLPKDRCLNWCRLLMCTCLTSGFLCVYIHFHANVNLWLGLASILVFRCPFIVHPNSACRFECLIFFWMSTVLVLYPWPRASRHANTNWVWLLIWRLDFKCSVRYEFCPSRKTSSRQVCLFLCYWILLRLTHHPMSFDFFLRLFNVLCPDHSVTGYIIKRPISTGTDNHWVNYVSELCYCAVL